jgi:GT2 family glycosyltransferase
VFAFLRTRSRGKPQLHAPLCAVRWDGHCLTLAFEAEFDEEIAVDLDTCFFSSTRIDATGEARFEFTFTPSGHDTLDVLPRRGRDGAPLTGQALRLRPGVIGVTTTAEAPPRSLAPLGHAAQRVPFGTDSAACEVAVVIPVYNAPTLVERCLESVLAHTTGRVRLIVIDDASPDVAIAPLLARYAAIDGIDVLRSDANRGFTATANRGIACAGNADVVLLNADAEVGPNWLSGLRRAAYSRDDVATATAVSDNAGAFSVPELEQVNALPLGWTFDESARALWQQAGLAYPQLPTGNGFCLYIRRTVIDRIGVLDEAAFPQGYGEENDFCQRAARLELRHVIAGNVLVRHARSQSFGEERRLALGNAGMRVLRQRWPDYERDVGENLFSFERRVLDWRVRRLFAAASGARAPKTRVLWVGMNVPEWNDVEIWNLRANGTENELVVAGNVVVANTWKADDAEASYRALWDWLQTYAIEYLAVTERKESVAETLCRMLDIPVVQIDATAVKSRDGWHRAASGVRSFVRHAQ